MGLISLSIPQVGQPDSTEEPKVASDLTAIANVINGGIDLVNLSSALQALVSPATWATYTPSWTGDAGSPSVGNGSLVGAYIQFGKTCAFRILLSFGTTSSGGLGALSFGLPLQSAAAEQMVQCKLFTSASPANWLGFGYVPASSSTVTPEFPPNSSTVTLGPLVNSTNTFPSTGNPLISGSYPLTNGSNLVICGLYQTT